MNRLTVVIRVVATFNEDRLRAPLLGLLIPFSIASVPGAGRSAEGDQGENGYQGAHSRSASWITRRPTCKVRSDQRLNERSQVLSSPADIRPTNYVCGRDVASRDVTAHSQGEEAFKGTKT